MKPISRISTRGYYDLLTGKTLKNNSYYLYPKKDFKKLIDSKELTIMIHGLRNDNAGAIAKVVLAKNKLKKLGYSYPVIGYSYDSNTTGAHLMKYAKRVYGDFDTGQNPKAYVGFEVFEKNNYYVVYQKLVEDKMINEQLYISTDEYDELLAKVYNKAEEEMDTGPKEN